MAKHALPADLDLTQTIARITGPFGSDSFKVWYAETFGVFARHCRCEAIQREWSLKYHYS